MQQSWNCSLINLHHPQFKRAPSFVFNERHLQLEVTHSSITSHVNELVTADEEARTIGMKVKKIAPSEYRELQKVEPREPPQLSQAVQEQQHPPAQNPRPSPNGVDDSSASRNRQSRRGDGGNVAVRNQPPGPDKALGSSDEAEDPSRRTARPTPCVFGCLNRWG